MNKPGCAIIGYGNLAYSLSRALIKAGYPLEWIISTQTEDEELIRAGCKFSTNTSGLKGQTYLVFAALADSALPKLAANQDLAQCSVVHTSGATPLKIWGNTFNHTGVFYPFQSFTKGVEADFSEVPILVESENEALASTLMTLGKTLSDQCKLVNEQQRLALHIMGVICNNFPNLLYQMAERIANDHGLDKQLLLPLLDATTRKFANLSAYEAQTGPARRHDLQTINLHLDFLTKYPDIADFYRQFTATILKTYESKRPHI